ncbi:putative transposable element [Trichonephila clavipes]|nr:putative transposable element [Trichonephila clavipes]
MKTSSVEFISRSPTPSPMERNYRRFSSGLHGSTAADSVRSEWPLWHAAKSNAVFARRRIELKLKQKLLDIRAELERKRENARGIEVSVGITFQDGDRFNSCQVIYSQFGLAIHQNDHQARRRFVEWTQNEIAVVPDFHKRILFSDEAHFWLNGYVNKQKCRIWSEANPQVYVETPLHPVKLTVWCALWAGGILLQKR